MFFGRRSASASWIVVFLGNPGSRYDNTRHNAGFMTADVIEKNANNKINRIKFNALTAIMTYGGERVFMLKPQTFMNLSGNAAKQAMNYYNVPLEHVIVVSDDVSLPIGKLRIRRSGSSGGHNGLKDIISKCGGDAFPRVKIGVGAPPHVGYDMADWVLSNLTNEDRKLLTDAAARAASAVEVIISKGVDKAMEEYN